MTHMNRLVLSAYGMNIADQIALVAVPIIAAVVFDASTATIGVLVACQSMAHLVGSLPFGLLVDNLQLRTMVIASAILSLIGFAAAALAIGAGNVLLFGVSIAIAGFGIVLFGLVSLSILPKLTDRPGLSRANAQLSLPRSIASFLVPLGLGVVLSLQTSEMVFWVATECSALALASVRGLPRFQRPRADREPIVSRLVKGGAYVVGSGILRPISLCAVFWNLAFAILLVLMVPLIVKVYRADPAIFARLMAAFGLAAILGTWVVARLPATVSPSIVLLFGPGSSVGASALLLIVRQEAAEPLLHAAFFLMGFGPSMWLVTQNTVRQLATPEAMLGRVNAVIQTAIYGIRPLGAFVGGAIGSYLSPEAGLWIVVGLFGVSFLSAAFSELRTISTWEDVKV
ncbi:MFS transporter [Nitratireductor soli]|uniref:MFS transporter n=1 Tax=Nitratireductor soli TaxID=1670619 RepID=UPI00065E282A|nr:MFS transporter [Nitratireductor soli]